MTPEQFDIFLEKNERSTAAAIEKYVNGGLRAMDAKLTDHITKHDAQWEEVKPIVETFNGGKMLGNFVKWAGGIVLTVAAVWALFFRN